MMLGRPVQVCVARHTPTVWEMLTYSLERLLLLAMTPLTHLLKPFITTLLLELSGIGHVHRSHDLRRHIALRRSRDHPLCSAACLSAACSCQTRRKPESPRLCIPACSRL